MDIEQSFTGDVNQVWISVNRFFSEMIPALHIVKKILITVELEKLIEDCKNIIAISSEGPILLPSKQKLTDSETLTSYLVATYLGNKLGLSKTFLNKKELQTALGKNSKITSTRLGELCREGYANKIDDGKYRITTLGIKRFQKDILPKIREKVLKKKARL
jgi:hypothetical protein